MNQQVHAVFADKSKTPSSNRQVQTATTSHLLLPRFLPRGEPLGCAQAAKRRKNTAHSEAVGKKQEVPKPQRGKQTQSPHPAKPKKHNRDR